MLIKFKRLIILLIAAMLISQPINVEAKAKYKIVTTKKYIGKFKLSFYCGCYRCNGGYSGARTASGKYPKAGRTIAVDPRVIPLGTKVKIGKTTYVAEDTGGAIKGKKIDVFCKSHSEALNKGIQYKKVYTIKTKKVKIKKKKKS